MISNDVIRGYNDTIILSVLIKSDYYAGTETNGRARLTIGITCLGKAYRMNFNEICNQEGESNKIISDNRILHTIFFTNKYVYI